MLDADLAELYGVRTKALNQAVKRNPLRFPSEFAFRLTRRERDEVVTNCDHLRGLRFSRTMPLAFTEHGSLMAANVLNSPKAVGASIFVIRAFTSLRETLASQRGLIKKLAELEDRLSGHDEQIQALLEAIRGIVASEPESTRRIGFQP
jgi:hypothetical protein